MAQPNKPSKSNSPTTKPTNSKIGKKQNDNDKRKKQSFSEEKEATKKEIRAKINEAILEEQADSFIERKNTTQQLFGGKDLDKLIKWVNDMNTKYEDDNQKDKRGKPKSTSKRKDKVKIKLIKRVN